MIDTPSFVCPDCQSESFNQSDIKNNYCAKCDKFHFPELAELNARTEHILSKWFVEKDGVPVQCQSMDEWMQNFGDELNHTRRVSQSTIINMELTTSFLGMPCGETEDGKPLLYETLARSDDHAHAYRYASRDAAAKGHQLLTDHIIKTYCILGSWRRVKRAFRINSAFNKTGRAFFKTSPNTRRKGLIS